jgi:hypothetical protein
MARTIPTKSDTERVERLGRRVHAEASRYAAALEARNEALCALYAQGVSLRQLAKLSKLALVTVHEIVKDAR